MLRQFHCITVFKYVSVSKNILNYFFHNRLRFRDTGCEKSKIKIQFARSKFELMNEMSIFTCYNNTLQYKYKKYL